MLPSFSGFVQPLSVAVLGCQPPFPFSSFSHHFLFRRSATLQHNNSKRTLTNADINYFVSPPSFPGPCRISSGCFPSSLNVIQICFCCSSSLCASVPSSPLRHLLLSWLHHRLVLA